MNGERFLGPTRGNMGKEKVSHLTQLPTVGFAKYLLEGDDLYAMLLRMILKGKESKLFIR